MVVGLLFPEREELGHDRRGRGRRLGRRGLGRQDQAAGMDQAVVVLGGEIAEAGVALHGWESPFAGPSPHYTAPAGAAYAIMTKGRAGGAGASGAVPRQEGATHGSD